MYYKSFPHSLAKLHSCHTHSATLQGCYISQISVKLAHEHGLHTCICTCHTPTHCTSAHAKTPMRHAHTHTHTHTQTCPCHTPHTHTHMRLGSHTVFTKRTCMCMNVHTCIVMYIACAPSSSLTHKYTHKYTHTNTHTQIHTHKYTHTHTHTQTGLVPLAVTLGFYFTHCFHKAYMCMNVHTCIVM